MDLENRMRAKVGLLSGGQRQAITILMAVLRKPSILLLDEHTAALDPRASRKIMDLTKDIVREQGLTALMVTHNLSHALEGADRIVMMSRGRVIQELQKDQLDNLSTEDLLQLFWQAQKEETESGSR
jgi:putative ABC transport system ATP-binding protein